MSIITDESVSYRISYKNQVPLINGTFSLKYVLTLQMYSHQSRLQTRELHELLRKPKNIPHVLQTCTMITGGGGIPPLPAYAQTVYTRPYLFSSIGLSTRLGTDIKMHSRSKTRVCCTTPPIAVLIGLLPQLWARKLISLVPRPIS